MRNDRDGGPGVWLRKAGKWATWILITGALANTMTAVFVGTGDFRWGLIVDPVAHPTAIIFFAAFFSLTLFNFAWFREQTCTIVCPYGRLQSVMLDPHSLVVAYDAKRGEPRGKPGKIGTGDCVDCGLCVKVCPTGIDIRNGNQLECIHCAACVDACDSVMDKLNRPLGLIGYRAESELAGGRRRILRPRTILYAVVLLALSTITAWSLATRSTVIATLLRSGSMPASFRDEQGVEMVRQALPLALLSRDDQPLTVTLVLPPELGARLILAQERIELQPGKRLELTPIVDVPRANFGDHDLRSVLEIRHGADGRLDLPVTLRRP
jgi:cytochrome c oxidase accessory protein FixG